MEKTINDNFTIEDLKKEQIEITKYTIILNLIFIIVALLLKLGISVVSGLIVGLFIGIICHWLLFITLNKAIKMDKELAVNFVNKQYLIRNGVLVTLVILALILSKVISMNPLSIIVGLLSIKLVIYIYNFFTNKTA